MAMPKQQWQGEDGILQNQNKTLGLVVSFSTQHQIRKKKTTHLLTEALPIWPHHLHERTDIPPSLLYLFLRKSLRLPLQTLCIVHTYEGLFPSYPSLDVSSSDFASHLELHSV